MKKISKRIISAILTVSMLFTLSATAFAEKDVANTEAFVAPRISMGFDFYFTPTVEDIVSDNNFFDQDLSVSLSNTQSSLKVVTLDLVYDGVSHVKTIRSGQTVTFSNIPWNAGTWTLRGWASSGMGWSHITIVD